MITATMTTDPRSSQMIWEIIQAEITGPVAGVWTITCPDDVTQTVLSQHVANAVVEATASSNRLALIAKGTAYLALPSPTVAQNTKALRALVMLQLEALTDISGT